jgi:hypothetical protein
MHLQVINNFITDEQQQEIVEFVNSCTGATRRPDENFHVKKVNDKINGFSVMNDMTKSKISTYVAEFQGGGGNIENIPQVFTDIRDKISSTLGISKDNVFLHILNMNGGGEITPHYDAGFPNYINFKCNVCVVGATSYDIHVDNQIATVKEKSLYTFEANMYKHWVDKYEGKRILLSYGFLLPCEELGYIPDVSPRIRLSNRIWKYYQLKQTKM